MTDSTALVDRARAWVRADPDPATRAELEALIDAGADAEIADRVSRRLEFGTAGLRGVVGAGPARMNRAVVIQTTRAVCDYLLARVPGAPSIPVVVGFDARLDSRRFAEDVVGVLLAARIPVRYFPEPVPTPLVAYAARQLAASAAIVVTASHNPPEYNGYKLYGPDAAQIAPPVDAEIAALIERVGPAAAVPRIERALSVRRTPDSPVGAEPIGALMFDRYLAELAALRGRGSNLAGMSIAYTPLHGVGGAFAERALRAAGCTELNVVAEQSEPDGRFPTVPFPNPEERGALDLVLALAAETRADLVLANDPDADRLAVAVPAARGYRVLTGNEVGLLLADYLLSRAPATPRPLVIRSIVSSPMLDAIATAHGASCEATLTGFKWVYAAALALERAAGVRFVFGYEEALGYGVGWLVRDKDGISAAVLFADLAADCRSRGLSVLEHWDALLRRHGHWVSVQHSIVLTGADGAAVMGHALDRLAAAPPAALMGRAVTRCIDYRVGEQRRPRWLGAALLFELQLGADARVLVRPSGTEPKLKLYVDLRASASTDVAAARERALAEAASLAEALRQTIGI